MKINYKIIWVDDEPEAMYRYISDIADILKDNYFIPNIQKPYISYEDFQKSFDTITQDDVYGKVFNDCDLLLIDYNIAEKGENKEKTGETLIKQLRTRGIYTEAVFYSNAMDMYRGLQNKEELDNVVYADKSELINKVEYIIKKTVVQSMIISNLRGYLMDSTSDFDFICRNVSEYYFKKLNNERQSEILKKAEGFIHNQYKSENKKFKEINKKYKSDKNGNNLDKYSNIFTYNEIKNEKERIKLLRKIFNSLESVIIVKDKFSLMALILQMNDIDVSQNIYSIDNDNNEKDDYNQNIIKHRNNLAHNKLIYGQKCKSRIKIIKSIEDLSCECDTEKCEQSYSYDDCKKLRENIYNYYLIFNKLFEQIIMKENGLLTINNNYKERIATHDTN